MEIGNAKKLPALLLYVKDWMNDPKLNLCTLEQQGFLMRLMCVMHDCEPYGHLTLQAGKPLTNQEIAKLTGVHPLKVPHLVPPLVSRGVLGVLPGGVLYSKRMVRDAQKRLINKQNGEMGGNPELKNSVNPPLKAKSIEVKDVKETSTSTPLAQAPQNGAEHGPVIESEQLKKDRAQVKVWLKDLPLYLDDPGLNAVDLQTRRLKFVQSMEQWRTSCTVIDRFAELKKAHSWEIDNPSRRKKNRLAFLGKWMRRVNNQGLKPPHPVKAQFPPVDESVQELNRNLANKMRLDRVWGGSGNKEPALR